MKETSQSSKLKRLMAAIRVLGKCLPQLDGGSIAEGTKVLFFLYSKLLRLYLRERIP